MNVELDTEEYCVLVTCEMVPIVDPNGCLTKYLGGFAK